MPIGFLIFILFWPLFCQIFSLFSIKGLNLIILNGLLLQCIGLYEKCQPIEEAKWKALFELVYLSFLLVSMLYTYIYCSCLLFFFGIFWCFLFVLFLFWMQSTSFWTLSFRHPGSLHSSLQGKGFGTVRDGLPCWKRG